MTTTRVILRKIFNVFPSVTLSYLTDTSTRPPGASRSDKPAPLSLSHTHTRSLSLSLSSLTYNFLSWVPPVNKSNHFVPRHPPVIFTGHQRGLVTVRVGPALHSRKKRRESQTNRYSGRIKFKHVVGRWDSVRCGRIWAVRSLARDSRCPVKKKTESAFWLVCFL